MGGVFAESDDDTQVMAKAAEMKFRRDDVYKMHTYRDALPGVHTALAVFPGTDTDATLYTSSDDVGRGGVGAIPLAPGTDYDPAALDRALRVTLSLADA